MYDHYFSNFGRPISDDICKDTATRHPRFWRRFLKVFPIQMHRETWPCRKKVKCQYTTFFFGNFGRPPVPDDLCKDSAPASSVLEKIFKGFYHIWAWRPSWLMDRDHFSNFSFPQPKEAPYEIWAKLAQRFQRWRRLKMLMDGRKVITISHP